VIFVTMFLEKYQTDFSEISAFVDHQHQTSLTKTYFVGTLLLHETKSPAFPG